MSSILLFRTRYGRCLNLMNWTMCLGDDDIGVCVCVSFGAPIMHKMSSRNLTLALTCIGGMCI